MNFYTQVLLAFTLVLYPALVKLKTDHDKPYFKELFICSFGGALLSLIISVNSHKKEMVNSTIAKTNDSLYKHLLKTNLESAFKIIDSLDTTVSASRRILTKSSNIIVKQNKVGMLLNRQLINTNQMIFEMYRNTSLFDDFRMDLRIHYDMGEGKIYKNGNLLKKTSDIFIYAKRWLKFDDYVEYSVYDDTSDQSVLVNSSGNYKISLDSNGKIYKITIKKPNFNNLQGFESFIPTPKQLKIKFYKNIFTAGTDAENYNKNLPDLIMEATGNNSPQFNCQEVVVDLKKFTFSYRFLLRMSKVQDNNRLRSAVDLNGAFLIFYGFDIPSPNYDYARLDYGPQFASSIEIDAKKVFRDFYHFPLKHVEDAKNLMRE